MITGLAHACFLVSDLEASIAFYRDKLGLTPAFDFVNEQGERYGLYFHVGGRSFIELFKGNLAAKAEGQSFQHICLEVDDIQATIVELSARGVEVGQVSLGSDNSWQAWITDPDGNRIELHGYTDKSWQAPWLK
ncbi:MAG TPA: VOC family protein [Armatimonadota bacterium]|nr:VOC family protein [Armatimonadota bacterium]